MNSAINLYLLIRLFDSNEKQKFLNRPATGALTLLHSNGFYHILIRFTAS